jgi:hypothetical protein
MKLNPLRSGAPGAQMYLPLARVTTVAELCTNAPKTWIQVDHHGREPFLLIPDVFSPGEYIPVSIYDTGKDAEVHTGLYLLDVHCGNVLLAPDTLVYWR